MEERISFEEEFLRVVTAEPFVPYTIIMSSGDRYSITADRFVAMSPDSNTVVVIHPKDGISWLRKNQVVAVDAAAVP